MPLTGPEVVLLARIPPPLRRVPALFVLLTLLWPQWHQFPRVAAATATMLRVPAAEDVSVSSNGVSRNGSSLFVEKTSSVTTRAFLKFNVSGITAPVASARILLRSTKSSAQGGTMAGVSSTGWKESTMTWANQPRIDGPPLATVAAVGNRDYYEWDVTPAIAGDGTYAFALTCSACASRFNSSEASGSRPYLIVELAVELSPPPASPTDPVLVGAGDIADCSSTGDEATAFLLKDIPGTVFTAGDNAYPNGSTTDFHNCYNYSWGYEKYRTMPGIGNHEYLTAGAAGYFGYFGVVAGDPAKGYYSYDLGTWHIISLNSNCSKIGGCQTGSAQEVWLRQDLAANPASCTLAYMHHSRFSSGEVHGSNSSVRDLWKTLYNAGAEIVVSAHDHLYERFRPQDWRGITDLDQGLRAFIVGTGGGSHYRFKTPIANSVVRNDDTFGVLKLTLHSSGYHWEFVPEEGKTFTDAGWGYCH